MLLPPPCRTKIWSFYPSKLIQGVNFSSFHVLNMPFPLPGEGQLGTERRSSGLWPARLLTVQILSARDLYACLGDSNCSHNNKCVLPHSSRAGGAPGAQEEGLHCRVTCNFADSKGGSQHKVNFLPRCLGHKPRLPPVRLEGSRCIERSHDTALSVRSQQADN